MSVPAPPPAAPSASASRRSRRRRAGRCSRRAGRRTRYGNPRPEPARYLLVMTGNIRRLIDAIHALPGRDAATVDAVFRAHDSEVLGWP